MVGDVTFVHKLYGGNRMNRNKKIVGIISGAVLVLAIIVVFGIIYATFTQQLTINGQAEVKNSRWRIVFTNVGNKNLVGTAKELTAPTLNQSATIINAYSVSLTSPGDSASYDVVVKNEGTYPAIISSVTVKNPICTGVNQGSDNNAIATQAATDATNVCGKLTYTFKNVPGATTLAEAQNVTTGLTDVAAGQTLDPNESKVMRVTLTYNSFDDATLLPKDDVNISNLDIAINYAQNGLSGQTHSTTTQPYQP